MTITGEDTDEVSKSDHNYRQKSKSHQEDAGCGTLRTFETIHRPFSFFNVFFYK